MHGGVKVYNRSPAAARAYVEADRSRVDDYYLAEGSGVARRFGAAPGTGVIDLGVLDGDGYEQWVAGFDPVTGQARDRRRENGNPVRFVEITVNGPKTWSLAAALNPEVSAAYDAAQDRAAEQVIGWVAEHATTRAGQRNRQVQVPVERLEAVTVRHYTSRAGDPHRHLHLQVNARVFAVGQWRGLHTVGFRDYIEALNGIGHAAVMCDPEFRAALAGAGFTLDPASGEILELAPFVGAFSERAAQIGRNIDRYEAEWRSANPGQEPGPAIRRSWDRRAWKDARPDKIAPKDGAELVAAWNQQLTDLGYQDPPPQPGLPIIVDAPRVGEFDRAGAVETIVVGLGARRSAWNAADIRGHAEKAIAAAGLVLDPGVRTELAEDITARAIEACVPLLRHPDVPEHIRSLTSRHVLETEADIVARLADRATLPPTPAVFSPDTGTGLDGHQRTAVAALAGDAELVVVEGAAGAGKTTTLAATQTVLGEQGRRMLVVTPTLKAAQVAAREVGTAGSVAWLVHQHGYRWDTDGRWTRVAADPAPDAMLGRGDLLLVDEAGMLDQDTARALLTLADEMGARLALVGDRHQLPAVGRGGVLDLGARWVPPQAHVDLDVAHRFADPEYAAISLALRTGSSTYTLPPPAPCQADGEPVGQPVGEPVGERDGEPTGEVWAALWRRGQVQIYPSEAERTQALAQLAADAIGSRDRRARQMLMLADTREQAAALNGAIRDRLVAAGRVDDTHAVATDAGERVGVGDRIATRRNDRDLGVTNRDTWTITAIGPDGSLALRGRRPTDLRTVPASYAREHVELAYATTVYGAQGETTQTGHLALGEHTSAASAYVAMTRGRDDNIAHLVAEDEADARHQWEQVFARDRADLGPAAAAQRAIEDIERYGTQPPTRPLDQVLGDLWAAWTRQADLHEQHQRLAGERDALEHVGAIHARYTPDRERLHNDVADARRKWRQARQQVDDLDTALKSETADLQTRIWTAWRQDLSEARHAADVVRAGAGRLGQHRRQVREASADLTGFAERWRPAVPDLATDPTELADQVRWLHGRRGDDSISAFIARTVSDAHPDADHIRDAERNGYAAYDRAERARTQLDEAMYAELRPYGRAAHTRDATGRLSAVAEELAGVERELRTVSTRLNALNIEPSLRTLPDGDLDNEHQRWADDRGARQKAATREANEHRQRLEKAQRIEPPPPSPSTPDHGRGIGR
ncbi:TrwC relaxase [Nocardioides immobilis]|uniref:TrwC relaxase n=1 Tax=Nocardioides immobilis TaxID=2049295 RepID=A0A417Y0W8_9ACTN|nr:MobF family relaxase [Nocardioides immobilis]RHW26298.1 TrwC relaxase [Nocardioides immobilis]